MKNYKLQPPIFVHMCHVCLILVIEIVLVAAVWTDHSSSGLAGYESLSFKVMFEVTNICLWQSKDQRQTVNISKFKFCSYKTEI